TNGGVIVFSSAPPHPMSLVVETTTLSTNISIEVNGSLFVSIPWKRTTTISLMSDIQWGDETIGDDVLSDTWKTILSNLSLYYKGETNVVFLLAENSRDKKLRVPREDRFLSLVVMPSLEILYHRHEKRDNMFYLYAYKKGSNNRSTYGIFVFREENGRWFWEGVYDPSLDYQVSF
ncbi:MAG: hypothetical protein ACK4TN_05310, partial [Brevinematales bacterium]